MTDLAVPGTEGLDGTAEHDDLLEDVGVWHNAIKATHLRPPAATDLACEHNTSRMIMSCARSLTRSQHECVVQ